MSTIIEELEERVEALRQRVEAFEGALSGGNWEAPVAPLTLYQTRLMRLIARKDVTGSAAVRIMACYYPMTSPNAMDAQLVFIRRRLPAAIAPRLRRTKFDVISVPDRSALKAFLETGEIPQTGRMAA